MRYRQMARELDKSDGPEAVHINFQELAPVIRETVSREVVAKLEMVIAQKRRRLEVELPEAVHFLVSQILAQNNGRTYESAR